MRLSVPFFILLLLSACGAGQSAKGPALGYDLPSASNPANGLLLIYRPKQSWRAAARQYPEVRIDGTPIGSLKYNGYLQFEASPGQHQLTLTGLSEEASRWDFKDRSVPVTLRAGETTYVQVVARFDETSNTLGSPGMGHELQLTLVGEEQARYSLPGMKESK